MTVGTDSRAAGVEAPAGPRQLITQISRLRTVLPIFIFGMLFVSPLLLGLGPPDPLIVWASLLCLVLIQVTGREAHHLLQYFYISFLYLSLYPFYLQEIAGVSLNVTGREVAPMAPATFAAVVLFLIGVGIPHALSPVRMQAVTPSSAAAVTHHRQLRRSLVVPTLGLLLAGGLGVIVLGADSFFASRMATFFGETRSGAFVMLVHVIKLAPCWFLFFLLSKRIDQRRTVLTAGVLLLSAVVVILNNPITTPRYIALTGMLVAIFPILSARNHLAAFKLVFPFLVWLVLPVTSLLRAGWGKLDIAGGYSTLLSNLEFSSMATLNEWMAVGAERSLAWGTHIGSAVLVFVPRFLWPGKNIGTGVAIAEELDYSFTNVGVPPLADAFLDFGWFGIGALGLATGLVLRSLPLRRFDQINCLSTVSCLPIMLFVLLPVFVRGDLSTFFVALYTLIVSHWVAAILLKLRS